MISSLTIALRTHDPATLPLIMVLLLMNVGISAFLRANWQNFLAIAELARDKSALLARVSDELEQEHALVRAKEEAEAALTQANRTLQTLASRDPLTGIANRRIFDRALEGELGRTGREGQPLSLLLFDVDQFKALNDEHGHQAGDECLQILAATLQTIARRPGDVIARYGGEEFAVVLPNASPDAALALAERARVAISIASTPVPVTVSVGVSSRDPQQNGMAAIGLRFIHPLRNWYLFQRHTRAQVGNGRKRSAPEPVYAASMSSASLQIEQLLHSLRERLAF